MAYYNDLSDYASARRNLSEEDPYCFITELSELAGLPTAKA